MVAPGTLASGTLALDPRRARAHRAARRHSRSVRLMRRAIPVGAAGAVILVAAAWLNPFADLGAGVSLGALSLQGTKIAMEHPRLSGFRKDDHGYEVTAQAAFQDVRKPFVIELQAMRGHAVTDDRGGRAHLEAATGLFDTRTETLELARDIRLRTDAGQEARLSSASVDLKAGTMRSAEPVTVTIPQGSIEASTLDVAQGGRTVSFVGNVHAVFQRGDADPSSRTPSLEATAQPTDGQR